MYFDVHFKDPDRQAVRHQIAAGVNPITAWRQCRGVTEAQLAKAIDCPISLIFLFESGNVRIVPDAKQAIAEALGVTVADLTR